MISIETFIDAVLSGDESSILHLISLGAKSVISDIDINGLSVLHYTASSPESELLTPVLLLYGAIIDAKDQQGRTPLHYHCAHGRTYGTVCLLNHGANPNQDSHEGFSPLDYAIKYKRTEIINLLVAYGGNIKSE